MEIEPVSKTPRANWGGRRPGAGRPRTAPADERAAIEAARSEMRAAMPEVARLWIEGLEHECEDPKHDCAAYRLSCAKEIASRAGLPKLMETRTELGPVERPPVFCFNFPDPFPPAEGNGDSA